MTRQVLSRLRHDPAARAGAALVLALVAAAAVGPWLTRHDPNLSDFLHDQGPLGLPASPSTWHWLGTDTLYRDLGSRLLHGARVSLLIALMATGLAISLGAALGMLAGFCHGSRWAAVDSLLMRLVDAGLSFPYLLLVMAVGAAVDRTDIGTVVLVLGTTGWLGTTRVMRTKTLELRGLDYVVASRALGERAALVVLRHVLPNAAGPLVVSASACVAHMILAESVLSYLSVGVQPPTATWGRMLRESQGFFASDPRLVLAPGAAILIAVLGFNLLGEGLRDALDPRTS
jgi:ABC-type dipeptide/oligopeptide/nickel transport system permease subunit